MRPWSMGSMIKELRKEAQISQSKLAEDTGLSAITISRYETGRQQPSEASLNCIMEYFQSLGVDWKTVVRTRFETGAAEARMQQCMDADAWLQKNIYQGEFREDTLTLREAKEIYEQANRALAFVYLQLCWQNQEMLYFLEEDPAGHRADFCAWCQDCIHETLQKLEQQLAFRETDLDGYLKRSLFLPPCTIDERRVLNMIGVLWFQLGNYPISKKYFQLLALIYEESKRMTGGNASADGGYDIDWEECCIRYNVGMAALQCGDLITAAQEITQVVEKYYHYGNLTMMELLIRGRFLLEQQLGWKQQARMDQEMLQRLHFYRQNYAETIQVMTAIIWYF